MKTLSVLGTAAMFLVGGGILAHGIPGAETLIQRLSDPLGSLAGVGALLTAIGPSLLQGVLGVLAGVLVLAVVAIGKRIAGK
jgi:hypothetical protein